MRNIGMIYGESDFTGTQRRQLAADAGKEARRIENGPASFEYSSASYSPYERHSDKTKAIRSFRCPAVKALKLLRAVVA